MTKDYLTVEEIAQILKLHWQTVLELIRTGQLEAIKLGKAYRVERSSLEKYLSDRKTSKLIYTMAESVVRIEDVLKTGEFPKIRSVVLSATFSPETEVKNIFSRIEGEENVVSLIENPPIFRRAGWDLQTLDRAKPVEGDFLEVKNGDRKILRVYRDGQIIAAALADSNFLGWAMQDYDVDNENTLNGLAVAEYITNFTAFTDKVIKFLSNKPESVIFHFKLSNPTNNKLVNRIKLGNWPIPEKHGAGLQVKEKMRNLEFGVKDEGSIEYLAAATRLWKEYCYLFGMLDQEVPFINRDDGLINLKTFVDR